MISLTHSLNFRIFQRVKCPRDFHPSEVTIFDSASNQFACAKFAEVVETAEFGTFSSNLRDHFSQIYLHLEERFGRAGIARQKGKLCTELFVFVFFIPWILLSSARNPYHCTFQKSTMAARGVDWGFKEGKKSNSIGPNDVIQRVSMQKKG